MKLKYIAATVIAAVALCANAQGYKDGVEFYKAQRFNQARVLLERNLNDPATDRSASYYYLGMIELQIENPDLNAAKALFTKGVEANQAYPYNYVGLGLIDLKTNNLTAANANFKLAEKYAKQDASSVQVAIARAFYDANPNLYAKEIAKRMEKAYKKNPENPDYYLFLADQAVDQRQWGEANKNFELAYSYAPESSECYVRYADILKVRNPQASIQTLQTLLQNNPQSALGQRELARTYYDNKMYREAAQQYGSYVRNPNHFDQDEAEYAFLLFADGDYKKGYEYARSLLAKNPDNYTALRYQFMNAAQMPELASQLYPMAEKLWQLHRTDAARYPFAQIDYTLIADQFGKAKKFDEARAVLAEGLKQFPTENRFERMAAMLYLDQEQIPQAATAYNTYISKVEKPTAGDLRTAMQLNYFAGAGLRDSLPQESAAFLTKVNTFAEKLIAADPADYTPWFYLGRSKILTATAQNSTTVAVSEFQKGIELLMASPEPTRYAQNGITMLNYLANAALLGKDNATARSCYERELQLEPDNAAAKAALLKIK